MTFKWSSSMSSESVPYAPLPASQALPEFNPNLSRSLSVSGSPFEQFRSTVAARTELLTNNEWTLIFPDKGASFHKAIQSNSQTNGYADFKGAVSFKLERYLETNLHYQDYRFNDAYQATIEPDTLEGTAQASPAQVLSLTFHNKTASKKLNYIDHPVIGTLIYFEPMPLEDAIDEMSGR
ncbi:hypothetical protein [Marinomonas ostreistagni]|uniref:hypothetical protein n=1 Tax=Marinomonas ostreistagni TaxID=359209 RepID=UPI00194FD985|nr:hypothetical protein [Marinomonas ostreistagni]MBM6551917.1 hypothetical protein [Marinomonas ostreistagni]